MITDLCQHSVIGNKIRCSTVVQHKIVNRISADLCRAQLPAKNDAIDRQASDKLAENIYVNGNVQSQADCRFQRTNYSRDLPHSKTTQGGFPRERHSLV